MTALLSWLGGFLREDRPQSSRRLLIITSAICMVLLTLTISGLVLFRKITPETAAIVMNIGVPLIALGTTGIGVAHNLAKKVAEPLAAKDAAAGAGASTASD